MGNEFVPQWVEDNQDLEIPALKGKYLSTCTDFRAYKPEDGGIQNISLNFCINETVEGNNGDKRFVSKTFWLTDGSFKGRDGQTVTTKKEDGLYGKTGLLNSIFTITKEDIGFKVEDGDTWDMQVGKAILACEKAKGAKANLVVRPKVKNSEVVYRNGWPEHTVSIVREFKKGKAKATAKGSIIEDF